MQLPHADGRCVICKHMVALFFAVFPNEVEKYIEEVEEYEREEAQRMEEHYATFRPYVKSLSNLKKFIEVYMKESSLRDLIAQEIHKLKPGLTLLQKEQYIPNEHGTKSFIDLYATDEEKRHVLIELKRSNAAARQAIHEVNKYTERIKQYFGAKDSEVHVIIASTEWTELLLPFSRLYADAGFSVEGLQIDVAEDEADFQVRPILPLPIVQGRFIAPWHNVYWYTDCDSFRQGIAAIEDAYRQKGIDDYVIVKFHLSSHFTIDERRSMLQTDIANMLNVAESELSASISKISFPVYEYIAYTAVQMLSKDKCLQIISRDKNQTEEVQELLSCMEGEELLGYLHESVESVEPFPKRDYYEIGYPAKFNKFYEHEDYICLGIVRHGIFLRNTVLTDDTLYSELRGEDGSTKQKFKKTVEMQISAHIKNLKENIATMLEDNPVWRNHILRIIEEIQVDFPESEIDIYIFNPSTGIFTIYYALTKELGFLYLPNYYILVKNPDDVRLYFGALEPNGSAMTFSQLLEKYYNGDLALLLAAATWGGKDDRDSDIIEDLGAQYRSYRSTVSNGTATEMFTLRDDKWRPCSQISPFGLFEAYVKKNQTLVNQIVSKIQPHDMGSFFEFSNTEAVLKECVDMVTAEKKKIYYTNAPEICDICKCSLADEKFMIDGEIKDCGVWANMCADCFHMYGVKIGWGYGQLYKRDKNGWLLVGGFCPDQELQLTFMA